MAEKGLCLVCGSTDIAFLFTAADHLVSGKSFALEKCNACGFTFTADPPEEKDISEYYISEDYISHSDKKRSLTDHIYHLARHLMLRKKFNLVRKVSGKATGTLLDIGSGTGYFADFMQRKGWNVSGIEISERARQYSISRFGLTTVSPSEISGIKDGSVDCVTLWHVLEHLYDPAWWMEEIKRILKDDGQCILALPNIESADAGWFGNEWAALDVPRHLWHFSPETLTRFIQQHGCICKKTISMPLDVFYISTLSYRNRGCRLPLLRGTAISVFLTLRTNLSKNRASSLIYVISKLRG
jgi:2-polyprenyl-3-methyl-5-hydroxy-6-metoxy-1,4-benzoquinol methylase